MLTNHCKSSICQTSEASSSSFLWWSFKFARKNTFYFWSKVFLLFAISRNLYDLSFAIFCKIKGFEKQWLTEILTVTRHLLVQIHTVPGGLEALQISHSVVGFLRLSVLSWLSGCPLSLYVCWNGLNHSDDQLQNNIKQTFKYIIIIQHQIITIMY